MITDTMGLTRNMHIKDAHPSKDWIRINRRKRMVAGELSALFIEQGKQIVMFIPSLDFTSYGKDDTSAEEMMSDIINDYFLQLINHSPGEVMDELKRHGWHTQQYFNKRYVFGAHVDKDGVLQNLELPKDTEVREKTLTLDNG